MALMPEVMEMPSEKIRQGPGGGSENKVHFLRDQPHNDYWGPSQVKKGAQDSGEVGWGFARRIGTPCRGPRSSIVVPDGWTRLRATAKAKRIQVLAI